MATREDDPLLTSLGRNLRTNVQNIGQAATSLGTRTANAANYLPKLVAGNAMADVANTVGTGLAQLKTGLQGREANPYVAPTYEGKTLSQLFAGKRPSEVVAAITQSQPVQKSVVPNMVLPDSLGDFRPPVAEPVPNITLSNFTASPEQSQPAGGDSAGKTAITVTRQPNGVLSFSGTGAPGATGAVRYAGMPNWTSQRGGAGQGAVDTGGQAFKPAQAYLASRPDPARVQYDELVAKLGRGEGGPIGVAQTRMQLQALAPIIERQMANQNAVSVANIGANTQMRGQDVGLTGEIARVGASRYATDVQAQTAEKTLAQQQAEAINQAKRDRLTAQAKALPSTQDQIIWAGVFGHDYLTGKAIDPQVQQNILEKFPILKGLSTSFLNPPSN